MLLDRLPQEIFSIGSHRRAQSILGKTRELLDPEIDSRLQDVEIIRIKGRGAGGPKLNPKRKLSRRIGSRIDRSGTSLPPFRHATPRGRVPSRGRTPLDSDLPGRVREGRGGIAARRGTEAARENAPAPASPESHRTKRRTGSRAHARFEGAGETVESLGSWKHPGKATNGRPVGTGRWLPQFFAKVPLMM